MLISSIHPQIPKHKNILNIFQQSNDNLNNLHSCNNSLRNQTSLNQQGYNNRSLLRLDSREQRIQNSDEMWREEVGDSTKKTQWYNQGIHYWQGVEATVDGVLGGYGHVNDADISASEAFLHTILAEKFPDAAKNNNFVALDCGSGIGRITKNLLIRYFNEVDLLEPVSHFLDAARVNLNPENLAVSDNHKAGNFYCVPLQDFTPEPERYDIIWIQWCIGHLADDDLLSFFNRAKTILSLQETIHGNDGIVRRVKRRSSPFLTLIINLAPKSCFESFSWLV
ncbi:hypothetical protein Leryth_014403 [Lithospermum erythrorhizon]|nr:hypothetical protein Leryth_014403 [Lithospermum erythrorhizon]